MLNLDPSENSVIPERFYKILQSCERESSAGRFPATEVFNEGWMLRLVLDAIQSLNVPNHPLSFLQGANWYSEALLSSPFRSRFKSDPLGEGFTNADGVLGHFDFRASTKSGLSLGPDARQFVVLEAKMFSNLSSGTKNAPGYNQAARNVACMAAAIAKSGKDLSSFESVGFFVIAPEASKRTHRDTNLEACLNPDSIRSAVHQRVTTYESSQRTEAQTLRKWESEYFHPLVLRLVDEKRLRVLSWEQIIEAIRSADTRCGAELSRFYDRCLSFAPASTN
ncbi:MAG: hypothetical protein Q8N04_00385 [Nitrospira sp.]|nr:hypothetical protein [Nitrospira sp.]